MPATRLPRAPRATRPDAATPDAPRPGGAPSHTPGTTPAGAAPATPGDAQEGPVAESAAPAAAAPPSDSASHDSAPADGAPADASADAAAPKAASAAKPRDPRRVPVRLRDEYPFYTDEQWKQRAMRHPQLPLSEALPALPDPVDRYLHETDLGELLDALALHPVDRAVAEMRVDGLTVRDIAARTGLKKWRIEKAMDRLRHRMEAIRKGAIPARHAEGWQAAYLEDARRRGKG